MPLNIPFSSQSYSAVTKVFDAICESGSALELHVDNELICPMECGISPTSDEERFQYIQSLISFASSQSGDSKECLKAVRRYLLSHQVNEDRFKSVLKRLDSILERSNHLCLKKINNDDSNVHKAAKTISFLEQACVAEFGLNSKPSEQPQGGMMPLHGDDNQPVKATPKKHQPISNHIELYSAVQVADYFAKTLDRLSTPTVAINIENIYRCTLLEYVDKLKRGDLDIESVPKLFLQTIFERMDEGREVRIKVEGSVLKKLCEEGSPEEWEVFLNIQSLNVVQSIKEVYYKNPSKKLYKFTYTTMEDVSFEVLKDLIQLYFDPLSMEDKQSNISELTNSIKKLPKIPNIWFSEGAIKEVVMPWLRHQISGSSIEILNELTE